MSTREQHAQEVKAAADKAFAELPAIEAKHTPGPWHTSALSATHFPNGKPILDADGGLIATVDTSLACQSSEPDANAHAIAALPALLALLEWAAQPGGLGQADYAEWLPKARAAIAQARPKA